MAVIANKCPHLKIEVVDLNEEESRIGIIVILKQFMNQAIRNYKKM